MVSARWRGSSESGGSGRPWATSQNGQRRVQMSPRIMNVAVPLPKHSPILGQEASSQTVCSFCRRRIALISLKRESAPGARTRIHAGLGSGALGTMRMVLRAPFSLTPGSRMFDSHREQCCQLLADRLHRAGNAEIAQLSHREAGITAGIDGAKGCEVHVDVERKPMVRPPATHADAERRDLGPLHIDARRPGPALAPSLEKVEHGLLEERHEGLDLDAAAAQVDQGINDKLARAVIRDVAAAVDLDERNGVRDAPVLGALAERVHRG